MFQIKMDPIPRIILQSDQAESNKFVVQFTNKEEAIGLESVIIKSIELLQYEDEYTKLTPDFHSRSSQVAHIG